MSINTCGLCQYYRVHGGRTPDGLLSDCCRYGIDYCDSKSKCQACGPKHRTTQNTLTCENFIGPTPTNIIIPPLPKATKGPTKKQLEYFNLSNLLHNRKWWKTKIPCYCCGKKAEQLHMARIEKLPVCHSCESEWISQWRSGESETNTV